MRDTRSEILQEAETLIRSRGYSGVSYADLATTVGIRKASIHHHFPTKTDLAIALLADYATRFQSFLDGICVQTDDGLARIRGYAGLYLQGVESGLGCLCAAFAIELASLPPELRTGLTAFFNQHVGWVERVLREGQANGTIRASVEPHAYAKMIVAALEGAIMMERVLDGPVGFSNAFSAIADSLRPA